MEALNKDEHAFLATYTEEQSQLRITAAALLDKGRPMREQHARLLEEQRLALGVLDEEQRRRLEEQQRSLRELQEEQQRSLRELQEQQRRRLEELDEEHRRRLEEHQRSLGEVEEEQRRRLEEVEGPLRVANLELQQAFAKMYALKEENEAQLQQLRKAAEAKAARHKSMLAAYTAAYSPATLPLTPDEYSQLLHSILSSTSPEGKALPTAPTALTDTCMALIVDGAILVMRGCC